MSSTNPAARTHWIVNATWKAASWSGWSCWTYLSSIPIWASQSSVPRLMTSRPQTPYSLVVRYAATMKPLKNPSPLSAMRNAALMTVPRAARRRRPPGGRSTRVALTGGHTRTLDRAHRPARLLGARPRPPRVRDLHARVPRGAAEAQRRAGGPGARPDAAPRPASGTSRGPRDAARSVCRRAGELRRRPRATGRAPPARCRVLLRLGLRARARPDAAAALPHAAAQRRGRLAAVRRARRPRAAPDPAAARRRPARRRARGAPHGHPDRPRRRAAGPAAGCAAARASGASRL